MGATIKELPLEDWLPREITDDIKDLDEKHYLMFMLVATTFEHDFTICKMLYDDDEIPKTEFEETLKTLMVSFNQFCVLLLT